MGKLLLLCILVGLLVSLLIMPLVRLLLRRYEERLEPRVMERFWRVQVPSDDPRFALDGRTAQVVHDFSKRRGRHGVRLSLSRICRNPYGEFFHVVIAAENDSTYVKHLSEERARMVLRGAGVAMPPPFAVMPQSGPDLA